MKRKVKKRIVRGVCLTLAAAAAAGLFLQTTMSVQAATAMPGIETIVKDNSEDKPFRILELVDNSADAEIGYYISGQEPYIKLYTYQYTDENGQTQSVHFKNLEEGLSRLPEKERKEFVMNVYLKDDGTIDESKSTGIQRVEMKAADTDAAPLSYTAYKEKYFLEDNDNADEWESIDLTDMQGKSRTDTVKVNGIYKENKDGTGDYTKEEQQYYPIRNNVDSDTQQTEKYRENIQNFSYIEADNDRAPYFLTFASVDNSEVNAAFTEDSETARAAQKNIQAEYDYENGYYGYYENVYADLNSEIAENITSGKYTFPGENPTADTSQAILVRDHSAQNSGPTANVTPSGAFDEASTAGNQQNPYIYLGKNIDAYPYYQYTLIGDLKYVMRMASESAAADTQTATEDTSAVGDTGASDADIDNSGDATGGDVNSGVKITLEDDQYWYWEYNVDNDSWTKTPLSVVTGRQAVSYQDVQKLPEDLGYSYYYKVNQVWFCCQSDPNAAEDPSACTYSGWYYPNYPSGEDVYLPVDENSKEAATHYISAAEYTLTPGTGDYDFVPGGNTEASVQVNKIYCQGGYTNHDWLKRDVFYLEPEDTSSTGTSSGETAEGETSESESSGEAESSAFENFHVEVDTRSASDWTKAVYSSGASQDNSQTILEDAGKIDLSSYDLIYINGHLSKAMADQAAQSQVPCVVNCDRAIDDTFKESFAAYIKGEDADGSYVNYQVYFYKNLFASTTGADASQETSASSLINKNFKTTFNDAQAQGFEPITKYIEQENQYRALGEKNDETGESDSLEPLSTDLSISRALEYVINYQYKRNTVSKDVINVLEIMPDNNGHDYTDLSSKIYEWIGNETPKVTLDVCCKQYGYGVEKMSDGDTKSYWHSEWNNKATDSRHPDDRHYITATFDHPAEVSGFVYTPRPDTGNGGQQNGVLKKWKVILTKRDGSQVTKSGETQCTEWNRSTQTLKFDEPVANVTEMKIIFEEALAADGSRCASCAELSILYGNIQVTPMTASEFVGHIDDLASEYDLIYIDGTKNGSNSYITGSDAMCYSHVGSGVQLHSGDDNTANGLLKLLGQLDTDYLWNSNGTKKKITYENNQGELIQKYLFAPINTYGPEGSGYFRGSGNDMTSLQCEELLDFVKSGYPVIAGNGLVSDGKINKEKVDNASYYYEFLTNAIGYDNVVSVDALNNGNGNLSFFANLAKPTITFAENGKPAEPKRMNTSDGEYVDGELKYVFTIGNDSDASPALTTYDCKLYLDLNFDGNLSSAEEQGKYIMIQDQDGNVVSRVDNGSGSKHYELQAGRQYTLTRKLPTDYFKLITWKLEVSSNKNSYIHTSETGYAKQKNAGKKQEINVLQLLPQRSGHVNGNWNLATDSKFQSMIKNIDDFEIKIETKTLTEINNMNKGEMKKLLSEKQMLVIGFDDVYQDISDKNGQVQDILDFIKSGKSVIFSHDTTSYINYDKNDMYEKIADSDYESGNNENTSIYKDNWLFSQNRTWGLSLNTILRSVVGMDRYGITSTEQINGETVSALLKHGKALNSQSVDFGTLMTLAGDIAWQTNGSRESSYAQTQAYQ